MIVCVLKMWIFRYSLILFLSHGAAYNIVTSKGD